MKIAVGTTSEQKIGYIKDVLAGLSIETDLESAEVKSGVEDQPVTSEDTKRGSLNRANGALEKNNDADIGLGIEVGYEKNDGRYEMLCWVSIVDHDGKTISFKSHQFPMPDFHTKTLDEGQYLADRVHDFHREGTDRAKARIRDILIYREPFIKTALEHALLLYLGREEYTEK